MGRCIDTRPCFAKLFDVTCVRCAILKETYRKDGECPFCKTEKEWREQFDKGWERYNR